MALDNITRCVFLLVSVGTLWFMYEQQPLNMFSRMSEERRPWQEVAAAKRDENMAKIPQEWHLPHAVIEEGNHQMKIAGGFIEGLLDSETQLITGLDVGEILLLVRNGSLTALQVTTAFCKRGAYAHQLNQNILEVAFEGAFERAKELDRYYEQHHKTVGPLHGLPISMKDQWHVKGMDTSMAYVGWIGTFEGRKGTGKEKTFESELVRQLSALGAILVAKSSETNNNILGYLWNPQIQGLSAGGSSGGEGAFQALRGSAIGFGSDIGGSVSIPAAYNGIFSFKPSHGRISFKGAANSSPGQMVIPTVVGILGPSIDSLRIMFESLLSVKPWLHDPEVLPLPYRSEAELHPLESEELTFGIFEADGVVTPHPPITRAVRMVSEALKAQGHNVILSWEPPSHQESALLHPFITRGGGVPDILENIALSGEPLIPQIQQLYQTGTPIPLTLQEFYSKTLHLQDFRTRYQDYWSSTANLTKTGRPVDAVVFPVVPHAAVIPGKAYYHTYASIINVLDYTTVVIPVTTANSKIDVFDHDYKSLNEIDEKNWKAYDPDKYDGAPASLQIIGRRLEEEKLLSVANIVVKALWKHNAKPEKL